MNTLTVGSKVLSTEHPKAVGEVIRINEAGNATIQFTTPPSESLPFGHIITEFWPAADLDKLILAS